MEQSMILGVRKYNNGFRVLKKCKRCHKPFWLASSRVDRVVFCSKECRIKYKHKHPEEYVPFIAGFRKGHAVPKEIRDKISKAMSGKFQSEKTREKRSESLRYFYREHPEVRMKLSEMRRGENHWNWKGGISKTNHELRISEEYKRWRDAVFRRDNWTCRKCPYKGHDIIAHHIKDFKGYPEFRFSVDNGVTLCRVCHKMLHYNIGEETRFKKGQYPWNKLPIPSKEELETLYWGQGLSTVTIAKKFRVDHHTVRKWLKHHRIPIRSLSEARKNYIGRLNIEYCIQMAR